MICGLCEFEPVGRLEMHVSGDYMECTACEQRYWINSPCKCRSLSNLAKRQERNLKKLETRNIRIMSELGAYVREDPKRKHRRRYRK